MPNRYHNHRLEIKYIPISEIKFSPNNARRHSDRKIAMLAASIGRFGIVAPVLIDDKNTIVGGEACVRAAL